MQQEAEGVGGTERRQTGCSGIHLSNRLLVTILGQIGQETLFRKEQTGHGCKDLKKTNYSQYKLFRQQLFVYNQTQE